MNQRITDIIYPKIILCNPLWDETYLVFVIITKCQIQQLFILDGASGGQQHGYPGEPHRNVVMSI